MSFSYNRTQRTLNEQIDPDKLDELAMTGNMMAKERQLSEIINALRYTAKFFSFVNEDKINFIADRLQSQGYSFKACKQAFDSLPERFDKFPSYKDLASLIKSREHKIETEVEHDPYSDAHLRKTDGLRNMWLTKYTRDQLDNFVKWYYKELVGIDIKELPVFGNSDFWLMNPLFDWHDNFYRLDKDELAKVYKMKDDFRVNRNKTNPKSNEQFRVVNANKDYLKYIGGNNE